MDPEKEENLIKEKNIQEITAKGNQEEIPKEVEMLTYNNDQIDNNNKDDNKDNNSNNQLSNDVSTEDDESNNPHYISSEDSESGQPIKKTMNLLLLNLNSYWLELIGSISLIFSILIYEFIALLAFLIIIPLFRFEINFEIVKEVFSFTFIKIGMKWLFFITISQHISVGFFCLTTFSNIFQETSNKIKFYILSVIKVALYYTLSVLILKVFIKNMIGGFVRDKINLVSMSDKDKEKILDFFDDILNKIYIIVANFLSMYNTFLEKLIIGTIYILLFYKPKYLKGKKKIFFRFLSLIPIIYIIISLVIRALHNSEIIDLNEFISPLLLGPKIVIYSFFVFTLLFIKYKSLKYNVFDSEKCIDPRVFTVIGSRIFGILGIIELIIGLFFSDITQIGIGNQYLLILCAPIITLYDYKRKYKLNFPFCKKGDFSRCLKITLNIVGYFFIFLMGVILLHLSVATINEYIRPFVEFIIGNFELFIQIASLFIN